jgi:hypothetical protein
MTTSADPARLNTFSFRSDFGKKLAPPLGPRSAPLYFTLLEGYLAPHLSSIATST